MHNTKLSAGEVETDRRRMELLGFRTIPLKPNARDTLHSDWLKRDYADSDWTGHFRGGGGYAIALGRDDLVLAIKSGSEPDLHILEFDADLGDLLGEYPQVLQGNGTRYVFMKKDPSLAVAGKVPGDGFTGLAFHSGGIVLGPGSPDPDGHKTPVRTGQWTRTIPKAPKSLLKLISREAKDARFRESTYDEALGWVEAKWLIAGLIPYGGFVQNYGKQKTGKTFVALDQALCVATGRDFYGHPVERGRVTYIAAEGSRTRFRDRITAWCRHNQVDPSELDGWFYFINRPVNFTEPGEVDELVKALRDEPHRTLIVIDTVAKNSGGMDEDTKGMKAFVSGANALRFATGSAVMVLHHEGKVASLKGRGSTVLPSDVDLSMRTSRVQGSKNRIMLQVDEARDTESGATMVFEMVRVALGGLEDEGVALELVGESADGGPMDARERILVAVAQAGSIKKATELVDDTVEGMKRTNVFKVVKALRDEGLLHEDGPSLELTDAGQAVARALGASLPEDDIEDED